MGIRLYEYLGYTTKHWIEVERGYFFVIMPALQADREYCNEGTGFPDLGSSEKINSFLEYFRYMMYFSSVNSFIKLLYTF